MDVDFERNEILREHRRRNSSPRDVIQALAYISSWHNSSSGEAPVAY